MKRTRYGNAIIMPGAFLCTLCDRERQHIPAELFRRRLSRQRERVRTPGNESTVKYVRHLSKTAIFEVYAPLVLEGIGYEFRPSGCAVGVLSSAIPVCGARYVRT